MLVDEGGGSEHQPFLLILLLNGDGAGDGIADSDGLYIFKMHLRCQEANHAADMRYHAAGEQAGDDAPPEPRTLSKRLVDMIGIIIARHAAEQRDIPLRKCSPERECLPDLHRLKRLTQLLLK